MTCWRNRVGPTASELRTVLSAHYAEGEQHRQHDHEKGKTAFLLHFRPLSILIFLSKTLFGLANLTAYNGSFLNLTVNFYQSILLLVGLCHK